jgi:cell wall-associated NlpC family hydrolase
MLIRRTVLSLILLSTASFADIQRREPSLFLEYERELKKTNDSFNEDDYTFSKNFSKSIATKSTQEPSAKGVVPLEKGVLKNTKVDTGLIGEDAKPFLVISKPPVTASVPHLSEDIKVSEAPATVPQKIIKNLKTTKEKVLSRAKDFLGTPYGYGDKEGGRTDCSGFTQQVYRQFGISLPRSAAEQARLGENVNINDLQVGDLLFYRTYKSDPSHVAIYAGEGKIIHASYAAKKVQYDSIEKSYYQNRFMYARRLTLSDSEFSE